MITLHNASHNFGKRQVLSDVSLQVNPKELLCIIGPSGAGKTTLLQLLAGTIEPTKGEVMVDSVDLHSLPAELYRLYRRRTGIVWQDYKLLWEQTVTENIAYPLEVMGLDQKSINQRVSDLLEQMDLLDLKDQVASKLAGGEQARTALARAIAHQPMILFADEPTGNIDPKQSKQVMKLIQEINKNGTTVVIATHDHELVDDLKPRVIGLEQGKLTRDAKGTYNRKAARQPKAKSPLTHAIFKFDESELPPAKKPTKKSTKKKIDIKRED